MSTERSTDVIDRASEVTENFIQDSLRAHNEKVKNLNSTRPQPKGECYTCGEIFDEGSNKLFCNAKCARDYEYDI